MRLDARTMLTAMLLIGGAPLAGCGSSDKGGNTVQMKDMEVVDGTATDAMTDLDGVQSEGTSLALPENRTQAPAPVVTKPAANATAASDDEEVVSDQ